MALDISAGEDLANHKDVRGHQADFHLQSGFLSETLTNYYTTNYYTKNAKMADGPNHVCLNLI
jgi:hypothetical protein